MKKGSWLVVAALALLLGTAGAGVKGFLIAALVIGVPYLIICRLAPRTRHTGFRGCKGSGEARSRLYPWAYHRCEGCNGTGRRIRAGARFAGPPHVKAEHRRSTATRRSRGAQHIWR